MDNETIQKFVDKLKSLGKQKIIIIAGLLGIGLILLSEVIPNQNTTKVQNTDFDFSSYQQEIEDKARRTISSIVGVGKCEIMITFANTSEKVYAKNIDENSDDSSYSRKSEYIFYEANSCDAPVLVKQIYPKVQGVLVVCEGGNNSSVKEEITRSLTSLFGISSSNVSVSKINVNR